MRPDQPQPDHAGHELLFPRLPYAMMNRAGTRLNNERLQAAVQKATLLKDTARKAEFAAKFGPRYDAVRQLAGKIKQHVLENLDYYLTQFADRAAAAGAHVHFARDAEQANAMAIAIANQHGSKLCVKSKSMVTEETCLLPALEAAGVETVETDLGEFILQIDDDAPSHLVTPMIHKDRQAVGRAFERVLGAAYSEDARVLTMIARRHLREKYRQADLGVSGGNFLIAETGTLVICTNEGNGRFCTSAPGVHVAMVGIEKLIPRLEHLGVFLKLLACSSTAQPLTVYTHAITGPRKADEHDGPEELHIILVDNGRTGILAGESREMLRCIRCGACLNACPVYRKVSGHSYGAVYCGPIGAVLTPLLRGLKNYPDLPNASSLCGACYEACAVHIDIPKLLIRHRRDMVRTGLAKLSDRVFYRVWAWSLMNVWTYRLGGWAQRFGFRLLAGIKRTLSKGDPFAARGWLTRLPGPVRGWTDQRDMPTPPAKGFRGWWLEHTRDQAEKSAP